MALMVSQAAVERMKDTTDRAITKLKELKDNVKKEGRVRPLRTQAFSGASAFGLGWLEGRLGPAKSKVLGVPVPLAAGILGHAVGFFFGEGLGQFQQVVHDVATGGVDLSIGTYGRALGSESRINKEKKELGTSTHGELPGSVGRELDDLDRLRSRVRT
jgi:hypothetical protein